MLCMLLPWPRAQLKGHHSGVSLVAFFFKNRFTVEGSPLSGEGLGGRIKNKDSGVASFEAPLTLNKASLLICFLAHKPCLLVPLLRFARGSNQRAAVGVDPGTALEPGALLLGPRPRRESRPGLGQAESHISQFALFSWEQRWGCR